MTSERVTPKFLARGNEIGVINAAFQDGQVSRHLEALKGVHIYVPPTEKKGTEKDETLATTRCRFGPQCLDL